MVTKRFAASDVLTLHGLGVRDVGENRDQEAAGKIETVRAALREKQTGEGGGHGEPLTVHFVGQLQSRRAAHVAGDAGAVHSLDRVKVVDALARGAESAERVRAEDSGAIRVSAGMSADLEQAVAAGATHLRVGTAILGSRAPLR